MESNNSPNQQYKQIIPFINSGIDQFHPRSKEEQLYRACQNFLGNIAVTTRRKYYEAITDFFSYLKISSPEIVKFEDVIAYRENLKDKGLSACTIALRISALRSLYKHLHEENLVKGNVFTKCRLPKVPRESRACCLTKDQAKALLTAPDRSTLMGIRDHLILSLLLYNVLRRGAIVNIKREDFRQEGKYHVLWYKNKGDEQVKTKLKPVLVDLIKDYLLVQKDSGFHHDEGDYLFFSFKPSHAGKKLTDQAVYYLVKKYAAQIGLETHPHELRHTGITFALDAGAKLEKVQHMAAHRSVQTTLRYYRNKESLEDHGTDYIEL